MASIIFKVVISFRSTLLNTDGPLLKQLQVLAHPNLSTQEMDKDLFYWSSAWRKLRQEILERDHHECQVCKSDGKVTLGSSNSSSDTGHTLIVHHIKPIEFYPNDRLTPDNLITVCLNCHNAIHFTSDQQIKWDDEWW